MPMTMQEIAQKLSISVSTVSRALSNQHDKVSEEKKNAILDLARKHGVQRRKIVGKNVAFIIDRELFNDCSNFYNSIQWIGKTLTWETSTLIFRILSG